MPENTQGKLGNKTTFELRMQVEIDVKNLVKSRVDLPTTVSVFGSMTSHVGGLFQIVPIGWDWRWFRVKHTILQELLDEDE